MPNDTEEIVALWAAIRALKKRVAELEGRDTPPVDSRAVFAAREG